MADREISSTTTVHRKENSLFSAVTWTDTYYNEAFSSPGQAREHWQQIVTTLETRGATALKKDDERARQMRHEDGATINPFDDPARRSTAWDLDPIPIIIDAPEWSALEKGLIQRAQLLEKILADVYGGQLLLRDGHLPVDLVFANPNYLYSCHKIRPPGNRFLPMYSADLYRGVDGRFRVLRDYAAYPAGLGYALENRIVMSRIFSELYHHTQTLRLATFFKAFHKALIQRASLGHENPGIVLLSPGPESYIYFEHALLSRYLGYPLVESQDLTVRNGKVFLKKLAGLEPVEAIFRHLSDLNCDPFALRRETASGVAGLIQVCRENNIEIINPIGSAFVDTPALSTTLPVLCKTLLGQDLLIDNHPAWWCGTDEGYHFVVNNLDQLTLSYAMEHKGIDDPPEIFLNRIMSAPRNYIGSAPLTPAVAPGWNQHGISNSHILLRVFVCATEEGYTVMPGGLAITAREAETLFYNSPTMQRSKDVWVLSDRPVEPFSLMKDFHSIDEFKRSNDLPSRVADNLLWLGRYLERTEGLVRLLRHIFGKLSGEDRPRDIPELSFLLKLLSVKNIIPTPPEDVTDTPLFSTLSTQLNNAILRRDGVESVNSLLGNVRRTARKVRDRLSLDSSRIINHLEDLAGSSFIDPLEFLDETLFALNAFSGLTLESMTRSLGWRFMDIGRRVERAINQTHLIRTSLPLVCCESRNTLETLLEISDSIMTYRARYRSAIQLAPVLDLLLVDESNPRSLAFQLSTINGHLEHLPRQHERPFAYQEERIALKMLTEIRLLELQPINCQEENNSNEALADFLGSTAKNLKEFSQQITGHYLTRVQTTPHFAMIRGKEKQ
ncbi:circularly permuted type 2 ATP-grasp protein [Desulfobulbus alkaliphilus]|uniref:circularly permuted type 2 ATP-grasp protein n=1 Tax=Desulfobulbus alkaliphilus TaxID=869814 RepID=UPI0019623AEE|nr:circularly permuted type 2 ATP-grasp protein [Desulfobulbus alkaliphilus]MBM9535704.1 circularly permuted type 2 ATP-grasp protein [Desulfobulbus alkaliphilus]